MIEHIVLVTLPALLASAGGLLLAFALHATVLLGLVWAIERLGGLKHPGWAEFAWRLALFGAFVSVAIEAVPTATPRFETPPVAARPAQAPNALSTASSLRAAAAVEASASVSDSATSDSAAAAPLAPAPRVPAPTVIRRDDARIALPLADDALLCVLLLWLAGCAWLRVAAVAHAASGARAVRAASPHAASGSAGVGRAAAADPHACRRHGRGDAAAAHAGRQRQPAGAAGRGAAARLGGDPRSRASARDARA